MIATGFFASIAAFIASGEMAFAYFTAHAPRASGRSATVASSRSSIAFSSSTSRRGEWGLEYQVEFWVQRVHWVQGVQRFRR